MSVVKYAQWLGVVVALCGMICPFCSVRASDELRSVTQPKTHDIRLTADHQLGGTVVDAQGQRLPSTEVALSRIGERAERRTLTDKQGRFKFDELSAGAYRLTTSEGVCQCRVWTRKAAPPSAASSILIVNDRLVQRGQRPIRELFTSDPIFMAAVVAAAIAIPIAVHKSRDDEPSGS